MVVSEREDMGEDEDSGLEEKAASSSSTLIFLSNGIGLPLVSTIHEREDAGSRSTSAQKWLWTLYSGPEKMFHGRTPGWSILHSGCRGWAVAVGTTGPPSAGPGQGMVVTVWTEVVWVAQLPQMVSQAKN